ncbi:MAG: response regulator transcription factor [Lactobacillales bacterium]|jgi:DNA-binding response OmpR family regulator|nr:response regulator transcription factor [Lactobacillales bacterium]
MKNKIYLVEDDQTVQQITSEYLERWGYELFVVKDFKSVLTEVSDFQPDLILLDISLPYFNGYYWCEEIRKTSTVPIIFLSSADETMNMVMAMNMGADDFIAKPFDLSFLLAKVQAIFRREYTFKENERQLTYKNYTLLPIEAELRFKNLSVRLTQNEIKILGLLFTTPEQTVGKETIIRALWESEEFISDNSLAVTMTRLRKKLNAHGFPSLIYTVKSVGYMVISSDEK